MNKITVSSPGKLHLLGEHVVVYGKPAIIAAVDKRCYITISGRNDKKNFISESFITEYAILEKTNQARQQWQEFIQTGNISLLTNITKNPLDYVMIAIGETLQYYQKKIPSGFDLSIQSDIPIGAGMGSSAALAVSIAGAISLFLGEKFDKEKINTIAYNIEQLMHGRPSGGDNATCCYGGLIWYQKKSDTEKIIKPLTYHISQDLAEKFCIINTGVPEETTGEMVNLVNLKFKVQSSKFDKIFNEQERLVYELLSAIQNVDCNQITDIIKAGERNLEKLGVVSESTKKLIREIENTGGSAKICGAGGRKKTSGIVLAFHPNRKKLIDMLQSKNIPFSEIQLGIEGIRIENNS